MLWLMFLVPAVPVGEVTGEGLGNLPLTPRWGASPLLDLRFL